MPTPIGCQRDWMMRPRALQSAPQRRAGSPVVGRGRAEFRGMIGAGLLGLLSACSGYSAKPVPHISAEGMPFRQAIGPLLLGVDPYHPPSRQQEFFGANLVEAGVLPMQVAVRNRSENPIRIDPQNFKLALPDKEVIGAASGAEIAALLAPQPGAADYAAAGVGILGGLGGTIGAIAGRLVSFAASFLLGRSRSDELRLREEDYSRKELKPIALGHDQSSRGFLYFILPDGAPAFDEATLTLEIVENQTEPLTFAVPMKGLAYKGRPSTKPDTPKAATEPKTK